MCGPAAGLIMEGVSTVMGVVGSMNQASEEAAQYNQEAQIAKQNAAVANQQAATAMNVGANKAANQQTEDESIKSKAIATYGASGVDTQSGSGSQVISDTEKISQIDQGNILYDASNNAWVYKTEGVNDLNNANMDVAAANNAESAGMWGAMTSLLTGGSAFANQYNQGVNSGLWGVSKIKVPTGGNG